MNPVQDRRAGGRLFPAWWAVVSLAGACLLALGTGCTGDLPPDQGANQSLVEIGERSLERGEEMEREDRRAEANLAYRRAIWAFRYHEHLTGEEPLLMDDALDGLRRTDIRRRD